jgi:hypothetical protein
LITFIDCTIAANDYEYSFVPKYAYLDGNIKHSTRGAYTRDVSVLHLQLTGVAVTTEHTMLFPQFRDGSLGMYFVILKQAHPYIQRRALGWQQNAQR